MIEQQLKATFDPYFNAPLEVWKQFADLGETLTFKKNQVIKASNQVERHGYFLLEGSCGVFVWKENGFVCLDLFLENSFFADDLSLNSGEPSPLQIVALEKSRVLRLSKTSIARLKETPMGKLLFLAGAENDYILKQQQLLEHLTKTADERYADLLRNHPELLARIHQKHIASYLGITTQSLSRIRKRIR